MCLTRSSVRRTQAFRLGRSLYYFWIVCDLSLQWIARKTNASFSWFLDNPDLGWTPPESLIKWMDKAREDGKPIVYIGFGSITVPNPPAMTRSIIKAVIKSTSFRLIQYSSAHICIFLRRCAGDCLQGMVITNGEGKRTGTRVPSGMLSGMLLITFSIPMLIGYLPTRLTKSLMSKSMLHISRYQMFI